MVFSTHSIVGGSLAVISGANPVGAFVAGMASHYLLDAIPHWDYHLLSKKDGQNDLDGDLVIGKNFLIDISKMILDLALGFLIIFFFFHPQGFSVLLDIGSLFFWPVLWGAFGGIAPDGLQFLYFKIRKEPLTSLQKFHLFIHTHIRMRGRYVIGPIIQMIIATLFIFMALQIN